MEQNYLFECESCGQRFSFDKDGVDVEYGVPFMVKKDRRSIFVTYYDCPKCDRRHYVQVDDTRSNQMKKATSLMFVRLSKKRINFKDIPKSQNEKFKKLNKKLEDYRFKLKKELNGQIIIASDNTEVEVHFSM